MVEPNSTLVIAYQQPEKARPYLFSRLPANTARSPTSAKPIDARGEPASRSRLNSPTEPASNPDGVSPAQIWSVLERGELSQGPHYNEYKEVDGELRGISAGDDIFLVVVIEDSEFLRVLHVEKRV